MPVMSSRVFRAALATLLTAAVSTSALASCMPGSLEPMGQMACCTDQAHDCDSSMLPAQCCESGTASAERLVVTKPESKDTPVLVVVMSHVAPAELCQLAATSARHPVPFSASSSPPLSHRSSVLRI